MRALIAVIAGALILLPPFSAAEAGVEIRGVEKVPGVRDNGNAELLIRVEGARLRLDRKSVRENVSLIYDSSSGVMTVINHEAKNYVELTAPEMARMKTSLTGAMTAIEAQLRTLPPAERHKMEQTLRAKGLRPARAPGASVEAGKDEKEEKVEKIEYVPLMIQAMVGRWSADQYEARVGRDRVAKYWVVPWTTLDIEQSEFKAIEAMQNYSREMFEGLPKGIVPNVGLAAINVEMGGFPVRITSFENRSNQVSEMEFKSIEKKSGLTADVFRVPAGYARRGIPRTDPVENKD